MYSSKCMLVDGTVECFDCEARLEAGAYLLCDEAMQQFCIRAQGWVRSKTQSRRWRCPVCSARACLDADMSGVRSHLNSSCLRSHLGIDHQNLAPHQNYIPHQNLAPRSSSSSHQNLAPHQTQTYLCNDAKCRLGLHVCGGCQGFPYPPVPTSPRQMLRIAVAGLVAQLNSLPGDAFPDWLSNVSDVTARQAARGYVGDDHQNCAGSCLMLAMLLPHIFGDPAATPLRAFGWPPPTVLIRVSSIQARSSEGPDNLRTNVIEGLLDWWDHSTGTHAHRMACHLREVWELFKVTLYLLHRGDGSGLLCWKLARAAIYYEHLPLR
jgi:hypothetical protein